MKYIINIFACKKALSHIEFQKKGDILKMKKVVYSNYSQEELDLEYDMRRRCPHFAETFESLEPLNLRMRNNYECMLDVEFGNTDLQKLDIWKGKGGSPILLFIHGGYWKAFDKNMFQFIAERFVEKGACVVLNNYDLCPTVTMREIISQNRSALKWIYQNAKKIGGDPGRIHVTGHSAGGHLTAMLMATNWKQYDLPFDVINGAVPISGLFDLEPLRISYLNADLHMTKEECVDVSPVHNLPKFMPPTVVAVGGGETDEFRRQSRIYTDKCREHGFDVSYLEVENHDHVNVVGELRNLNSPLTSALLYQMGL